MRVVIPKEVAAKFADGKMHRLDMYYRGDFVEWFVDGNAVGDWQKLPDDDGTGYEFRFAPSYED